MARASAQRDTSIRTYRAKRDFSRTAEPAPAPAGAGGGPLLFVVQKHAARRAGLHWDFRLEHGGVLWSWAVPQGPSLDPADRRLAAHVEDHPLDYADFQGDIPAGQYGAGEVETWDRGSWEPIGDPEQAMRKGELEFVLHGARLKGRFHLVRLNRRARSRSEGWLLIKGHDEYERAGVDARALEAEIPPPPPPSQAIRSRARPPAPGAVRGSLPVRPEPQLASSVDAPPGAQGWLGEIKLDGYRLLARIDHGKIGLYTRNGHDWADRLPAVVKAVAGLGLRTALLDGELVALREDGTSSFPDLQAALSQGQDKRLNLFVFDLLHLNGWDLRPCALSERKQALAGLADWRGMIRYSDHVEGRIAAFHRQVCGMGLEGIVCKRADAPYRAGRSKDWLKVKCHGREELIVLGWTMPRGSRTGLGSLQLGYHDEAGRLHYAGGVGTGFDERALADLRTRLDALAADPPEALEVAGEPLDPAIHWVRPELVAEVRFSSWSGAGRVRHAAYLGLREDKQPSEVVLAVQDPEAERKTVGPRGPAASVSEARPSPKVAVPPVSRRKPVPPGKAGRVVIARAPKSGRETIEGVELSHATRQLWPGITKRDLADYWLAVAERALPGLAHRPLAILRCPEGIDGEHFFQKRANNLLPPQIREGSAERSPFLAIDDAQGLVAMAQMSAIELHPWGARESDPLHPDRVVFDLDPGEDVGFDAVVKAAHDLRDRLQQIGFTGFARTTGGKGLHVVVPIEPRADWEQTKRFCRRIAEAMSQEEPDRFLSVLAKPERHGRILIDYLRNGLGSTAIASFCPRARPGAAVAMPLSWAEMKPGLDPAAFNLLRVPDMLKRQRSDPWSGFRDAARPIPPRIAEPARRVAQAAPVPSATAKTPAIVVAAKPRRRR